MLDNRKLAAFQFGLLQSYTDLGLSRLHAATAVTDLASLKAFGETSVGERLHRVKGGREGSFVVFGTSAEQLAWPRNWRRVDLDGGFMTVEGSGWWRSS